MLLNFAKDNTATQTAKLTKVSIRSVNSIYLKLRQSMALELDKQWEQIKINHGEEIKMSRRPIVRPCRQNGRKILVLVLSRHHECVHLEVVPDARKDDSRVLNDKTPIAINAQDKLSEQLWLFLDGRLSTFRGISNNTFAMHVKETAFRFNHQDDLYQQLITMLEQEPL